MIQANETFDGTWPYQAKFSSAAGFRQHYVDEGSGRPIVLLHGQPTWGYIYRRFIPPLASTHRVVVPDHMGFGKSETPQDRVYTLSTHVANLTALIESLDLRDITLVMQDRAIPPALALADFKGLWPGGTAIEVAGAGHYIQEDAPEVAIAAIQAFLAMV